MLNIFVYKVFSIFMITFFTQDRTSWSNFRLLTHINKKLYKKFAPILNILLLVKHHIIWTLLVSQIKEEDNLSKSE